MTETDKLEAERWGIELLGIMGEEDLSFSQKIAVIELMQEKLFPPIKLMIEGKMAEIPSWQVMIFEKQFAAFKELCERNCKCTVSEWVKKTGSDESIAETLIISYLRHLATPEWIAFLKHKIGLNECMAAA